MKMNYYKVDRDTYSDIINKFTSFIIDKKRNYEVGDLINLQVYTDKEHYKSTTTLLKIISIYDNSDAIKDGYCVISFILLK